MTLPWAAVLACATAGRGAHTFSGGATIAGGPRLAISPSLELQRRDDRSRVTSFFLTFVHRF